MGWFNKETVIGIAYDDRDMKDSRNREPLDAIELFITSSKHPLFAVIPAIRNGYITYVMAWDGSKEGWDASDEANKIREEFILKLQDANAKIYHIEDSDMNDAAFMREREKKEG